MTLKCFQIVTTKTLRERIILWKILYKFKLFLRLLLTRWLPVYDIFALWFRPKKQQFSVALPTP